MLHHSLPAVLTMSQYKPDSSFQKPYVTQDYFTNISWNLSGGSTAHAYTAQGTQVNFLQQFGTEDLLQRFIDQSLPVSDTTSIGKGTLKGEFHVRELILGCYKNINHGFFIEGATAIQDLFIDAINVQLVPTPSQITDEQRREKVKRHTPI
jgi:hypothetical protein